MASGTEAISNRHNHTGAVRDRQLSEGAAEVKPTINVLFTSGYAEKSIIHDGRFDSQALRS
jgi:hypothetical protein